MGSTAALFNFRFFGVSFASSMSNKGYTAYFSPISNIICRKEREKFNLKFSGLWISTNSTIGSPNALLEASFKHFPRELVSRRKKLNTFDSSLSRISVGVKKMKAKGVVVDPLLCYPPLKIIVPTNMIVLVG